MAKADARQQTGGALAPPNGEAAAPVPNRKIPGNLPYLPASGTLRKAMDRLIDAQRPDKFNADFLENVLKLTGGAARGTIPILKRMGFLSSDGTPTDLYARFRSEGNRSEAALLGLRAGFAEIFRRSEYAHLADDAKLKDLLVEITGLKANDPVVTAIRGTFNVVRSYISKDVDARAEPQATTVYEEESSRRHARDASHRSENGDIRLSYNINIVLPETSDLNVLNAIFRSLRENLMR